MPSHLKLTLLGHVIDFDKKVGIEGIRIEVQDRQTNTLVAVAWTDENGFFRTEISKMPEVRIDTATDSAALDPRSRVNRQPEPTVADRGTQNKLASVTPRKPEITILLAARYELRFADRVEAVRVDSVSAGTDRLEAELSCKLRRVTLTPIEVESVADLETREREIVERINHFPNGGQLFLIHPFLTFAEVGVVLGRPAREALLAREPKLSALSPVPFHALLTSKSEQSVRVNIHGLFRRQS